mgnify:CR=1 FL=1
MAKRFRHERDGNSGVQFAASAVDIATPEGMKYLQTVLPASRAGSRTAWDWHEKIGEIHYAVGRSARIGGYAKLRVHKLEKDGTIGEPVTTGLPGEIADMLYSPYGGQRGLLERFLTLMKVPADSYLVQCRGGDNDFDGFDFLSADEIKNQEVGSRKRGDKLQRITLPGRNAAGAGVPAIEERIAETDFIGRVWRPSSRYVEMPDSPLTALDTSCELLHLLTLSIRSTLMSRLLSNGIFYVPSEVNDAKSTAPSSENNEFHKNNVLNELIKAAVYAASNRGEAVAGLPVFMTGPAQYADGFKHIIMEQVLAETDMKLRAELIDRILQGLDVQPSQVKGAQDENHWGSWSATDDELKVTIKPDLETGCWALTRLVLHKLMLDAGRKPSDIMKYVVWYDLDAATSHMNIAEDARQLIDRNLVSPPAARRMNGIGEKDAPTNLDIIRQVGYKMGDPYLATFGMPEAEKFDWEKIGSKKTGVNPDSPADAPEAGPGKGSPGGPSDNKSDTPKRLRPA